MTRNIMRLRYFEWICNLIDDYKPSRRHSYTTLLNYLDDIDFEYTIDLDGNRAADGIDFRYRFGDECGYDQRVIARYLDDRPCSMLEMMVAMSVRCEEHIMDNPLYGDRTGKWFWAMIENLGLSTMDDTRFDRYKVSIVIQRCLNRDYRRNGAGGLFTVQNPKEDMRNVEIWYQLSWYLSDIIENEEEYE